jgi:hypothetical protein
MQRLKVTLLALVAVFAVSGVASATASAETSVFDSTAPVKSTITSKALANQVFTTSAGKVVCKKLKTKAETGEVVFDNSEQAITIEYEECTAFTFPATISPARYVFHAGTSLTPSSSNGTADIKEPITIKATGCTVTVPAQNGLGSIEFKTVGSKIELVPSVTGIKSSGTGFACKYAEEANGKYEGASSAEGPAGSNLLVEEVKNS